MITYNHKNYIKIFNISPLSNITVCRWDVFIILLFSAGNISTSRCGKKLRPTNSSFIRRPNQLNRETHTHPLGSVIGAVRLWCISGLHNHHRQTEATSKKTSLCPQITLQSSETTTHFFLLCRCFSASNYISLHEVSPALTSQLLSPSSCITLWLCCSLASIKHDLQCHPEHFYVIPLDVSLPNEMDLSARGVSAT